MGDRLDSPEGRERSRGVAGVSLELGRRSAPEGSRSGIQWRTRATVSTSRGSSSGVQAAGVSESGEVQALPCAGALHGMQCNFFSQNLDKVQQKPVTEQSQA